MWNDLPMSRMVGNIKIWPVHSRPEYRWFVAYDGKPHYFRSWNEAVLFVKATLARILNAQVKIWLITQHLWIINGLFVLHEQNCLVPASEVVRFSIVGNKPPVFRTTMDGPNS